MPDPHVYPDPQTAPLTLAAPVMPATETKSLPVSIEQLAAPDATQPEYAQMMYIRVAMSGALCASSVSPTAPKLYLTANTGDPVLINDHSQGPGVTNAIYDLPGTALANYIGDGSVILDPDPAKPNVFLITVGFQNVASYNWTLTIGNIDPASSRDFTWVVSATKANTAQPWIDVEPATLSWDVLINGSAGESVTITNRGTTAFIVTGLSAALPPTFTLGPLPPALNPGTSASLTVTFAAPGTPPGTNGVTAAQALVTTTPADNTASIGATEHNNQLSVSALTQALEIVVLLDDSGSMSWDPLGNSLPPNSPSSRWNELVTAVNTKFFPLLGFFGKGFGKFGVAIFPPKNPLDPSTFDILNPPQLIPDANGMSIVTTPIANITPTNGTPMGDGINRVFGPITSYFATDALSIAANRRWLLLMTDGAWNMGENPMDFVSVANGGTAAPGASLADKNVSLFAIGYGITGHSDVNPAVLQSLASGSKSGQVARADDNGLTASEIASAFEAAIKGGITPTSSPGDPSAIFIQGQAEARHYASITPYDHKAAFALGWNTPDPNRMRLELLTPTCDVITPEGAAKGAFPGIVFVGGNRSQMYLVDSSFLSNAADPSNPRYGTWTLLVTSPELSGGIIEIEAAVRPNAAPAGFENYDYDIIVDSDLRMTVTLDQGAYYAGDPIRVSARLTSAGRPIKGASVSLSTTSPEQSEANWLAGLYIPANFIAQAQKLVQGDSTSILVKEVAAGLAGMVFPGAKAQSATAMTDPRGIGTYEATITNTSVPETYTFYVTATGVTDDKIAFRREGKIFTHVLVRPEAAYTKLVLDLGTAGAAAQATLIPQDRFGNVLLIDPASFPGLALTIQGGAFTGPLVSQLNGTYTQPLTVNSGAAPILGLTFNGQTVQQQTVPPIPDLTWVNKVIAFVRGAEASPGANKHTNPNDALGDPQPKPAGTFVALGAGGSLTVAVEGQVILAQGDADVTVFVQPSSDSRPYLVEALRGRDLDQDDWVTLGTASGATSSFGLRKANLDFARAIRITDKSGRTRDTNLQPLDAPGACIRAIGVTKVGSPGDGGDICIRIRVLNPAGLPLGGTVDIEFQSQEGGQTTKVTGTDASKDIDVKGLARFPQVSVYEITVTPTDVFKPTSQFSTIPPSGFNTVVFTIAK